MGLRNGAFLAGEIFHDDGFTQEVLDESLGSWRHCPTCQVGNTYLPRHQWECQPMRD